MKIVRNHNDEEFLKTIEQAIADNDGYCCCAVEKTPDTKCPCKEFIESTEKGPCHCGRYIKVEL